jgi:hypothetical protein
MPITRIDSVQNVRILNRGWTAIAGRDHRGIETDIAFSVADASAIAPQLLCCAAIEAGPDPKPLPGTIVPGCHLPVMAWRAGRSTINSEAILVIDIPGGATLRFQFPGLTAQECGKALAVAAMAVSPPFDSRPN